MRTTVIVKKVKWKGVDFIGNYRNITKNYQFFAVKEFGFLNVNTATETTWKELQRGHYTWDTRSISRYVTIVFWAFAHTKEKRFEMIQQVDKLFDTAENPNWFASDFWLLEFTDPTWKVWDMEAQVVDRITPGDFAQESWIEFRVRLLVKDDSCMYSDNYTINTQNNWLWVQLEEELSFPLHYPTAPVIDYEGVSNSRCIVTCTACIDNATPNWYLLVRVYRSDNSYDTLYINNIYMNIWDVLVVNSFTQKVTLNGFDITWQLLLPYFAFPVIKNLAFAAPLLWDNKLIVDVWVPTKTMDVVRNYRDARC